MSIKLDRVGKMKAGTDNRVKLLSFSLFLLFSGFITAQQYVTTFFTTLGMPYVGFTSLIIVYVSFMISSLLGSYVIARYGAKRSIIAGAVAYVLYILSLTTGSAYIVYFFSVLLGLGSGLVWVGQNSYIIRVSQRKVYGRSTGFFNSLTYIGQLAGVLIAGILVTFIAFKTIFVLLAVPPVIGIAYMLGMHDVRSKSRVSAHHALKKMVSNPLALRVAAIGFAMFFVTGLNAAVVTLEVKSVLGIGFIGPLTALFYIMPAALSYSFGKSSDRIGRMKLIPYAYMISIIGIAILYFAGSLIALAVGIFLLALTAAVIRPLGMALVGDVSTGDNLEAMTGLYWAMTDFGFVMALVISVLFPGRTVFLAAIAVMALSFIVVMPLFRTRLDAIKSQLRVRIRPA